ncbi:MAG: HD domain-containing protein [Bacteroidetes bacterium]|nr:HD domain-containing protein [Bacteroidota bacterium]
MSGIRKIVNDPVYGFITISHPLVLWVIDHPYYQRLRRIQQMALAQLVYPGAVHTRLHHSMGAYHLMCNAIAELRLKNVQISPEEEVAAEIAILLHDIGHGPFSHALEQTLIQGVSHETLSLAIMEKMNEEAGGKLSLAIQIFKGSYEKPFLHQLISGQLDVDRMDYLTRDSFYTGVSEGVIGYDRILKMLAVREGELLVEEKAVYSIEKFLVSRRLMYWQVYLHKTVLCVEKMLVKIIQRARMLISAGVSLQAPSPMLDYFLRLEGPFQPDTDLALFCQLDDTDILAAIKCWTQHGDKVLATLCGMIIDRKLLKVKLTSTPVDPDHQRICLEELVRATGLSEEEAGYLVFSGESTNTTYNPRDERIRILFKDGSVKDISSVDNALIQHNLSRPVKKYYFCYLNQERIADWFNHKPI